MTQEFAMDLRTARINSGLRQADCAHLMGADKSRVCRLETGVSQPSVREICMLSMIYGRSFESLFSGIFEDIRGDISLNILTLREPSPDYKRRLNRERTLQKLEDRLDHNPDLNGY